MTLRLNGSTSGYVEIDAPAVAGDNTLALPSTPNGSLVALDSSGRLGIGTSSPSSLLHIAGSSPALSLIPSGATNAKFIFDNSLTFSGSNGSNDRLHINFDGNVGIGTTSPAYKCDIDVTGSALRLNSITTGAALVISSDDAANAKIEFGDESDNDRGAIIYDNPNNALIFQANAAERARIDSSGRLYSLPTYNNTAAASANMHVDSNGIFYRATSSAKYKTDIETLEDQYADALLNVRPVWYRSTTGNEPTDWSWYGFIAEEVAEIDPRLVHWKTVEGVPNENGQIEYTELETPVAEGVQYERFVPHLLNLIKRQKEQIESQGAAIAALEARLTALEVTP